MSVLRLIFYAFQTAYACCEMSNCLLETALEAWKAPRNTSSPSVGLRDNLQATHGFLSLKYGASGFPVKIYHHPILGS